MTLRGRDEGTILNVSFHSNLCKSFSAENLGDWKARIDEEDERELDDAEEEESDEEEDRHIPEEDTETFLDDIPSNISEMDDFLNTLMHQRRKLNRKLHSHVSAGYCFLKSLFNCGLLVVYVKR
jgi:hypothetical protein